MRIDEMVVGGLYSNGKKVRQIIAIKGGEVTYRCVKSGGRVLRCWITTMAGWAKERVERELDA